MSSGADEIFHTLCFIFVDRQDLDILGVIRFQKT